MKTAVKLGATEQIAAIRAAIADPRPFGPRRQDESGRRETIAAWGARAVLTVVTGWMAGRDREIERLRAELATTRQRLGSLANRWDIAAADGPSSFPADRARADAQSACATALRWELHELEQGR